MRLSTLFTGLTASLAATAATAQDLPILGRPEPGGTGFQAAATELMRDIIWLDTMLLVIIAAITVFVTGLLIWVMIRYNEKKKPQARDIHPSQHA